MTLLDRLAMEMIAYDKGDPKRIHHFLKVHDFARLIGVAEGLEEKTLFRLEAAAYVHDIGIHEGERRFGRNDGKIQEDLGPAEAEAILERLGFEADLYFCQLSDMSWSHAGVVYFARTWEGTPRVSDEMEPRWFTLAELPYEEMWEADKIWLPMVLAGKKLRGTVYFAEDGDHVTATEFREVPLGKK